MLQRTGLADPVKVVCLGLDGAGKTALLNKLKLGECVHPAPTSGCNVESLSLPNNVNVDFREIGGGRANRPLIPLYLSGEIDVVVWVVDSSDRGRFAESRLDLERLLQLNEMTATHMVVAATKQDIPGAASVEEVEQSLQLRQLLADRLTYRVVDFNWAVSSDVERLCAALCPTTISQASTFPHADAESVVDKMLDADCIDSAGSKGDSDRSTLAIIGSVIANCQHEGMCESAGIYRETAIDNTLIADVTHPADPENLVVNAILFRASVFAHHLLGAAYAPTAKAVRFGRMQAPPLLPAEMVSRILEFLPLRDLLPRGHLDRRYARVWPQGCWLVNRTFLIRAFAEATRRITAARLVVRVDVNDVLRGVKLAEVCRAVFCLRVPAGVEATHLMLAAMLLYVLQEDVDCPLPAILRIDPAFIFVDCNKHAPGPLKHLHIVADFLRLSGAMMRSAAPSALCDRIKDVQLPRATVGGSEIPIWCKTFFAADKNTQQSTPVLLRGLRKCNATSTAAVLAYLKLEETIRHVAHAYSEGFDVPSIATLEVRGSNLPIHDSGLMVRCILTQNYRVLVASEQSGDMLTDGQIEAVIEVIAGRPPCTDGTDQSPASRCEMVALTLRVDVFPRVIAAICDVATRKTSGSVLKSVVFTFDSLKIPADLLSGDGDGHLYSKLLHEAGITWCLAPESTVAMLFAL
jgi:ADP-ribosylation factor-like protein 4